MNLIAFMTFSILVITILTLVFGVLAYFLYKVRESKKKVITTSESYDEILERNQKEYIFFKEIGQNE